VIVDEELLIDLRARVDRLVADFPPATTSPEVLWDAQYEAGLAWVQFPLGYGGLGVDIGYADVVEELLVGHGAPRPEVRNLVGICTVAPTLAKYGSVEQLDEHLRPTFSCKEIWCQLFSEPGAGSDLAALSTRAERDGRDWLINGQKVWTTLGHCADFGILLARTNFDVPKHKGITVFLADMHKPGIEVRPLRQITGEAEYNEVYLTDARLPDRCRLGSVDEGWAVALDALNNERRIGRLMVRATHGSGPIGQALDIWHAADPATRTSVRRDRLAQLWIETSVTRLTAERADAMQRTDGGGDGVSVGHMARGPLTQRIVDFCMELRGPEATLVDDYEMRRPDHFTQISGEKLSTDPTKAFLAARSLTIAGGSTEIGKNAAAERVLGLPREPRFDRDVPFKQALRPSRDDVREPVYSPRQPSEGPATGQQNVSE
jgi:alkylation response protein AidB-like acyl-CoA dehydrogenase